MLKYRVVLESIKGKEVKIFKGYTYGDVEKKVNAYIHLNNPLAYIYSITYIGTA